jgi:hypothetical protein
MRRARISLLGFFLCGFLKVYNEYEKTNKLATKNYLITYFGTGSYTGEYSYDWYVIYSLTGTRVTCSVFTVRVYVYPSFNHSTRE